jgi:hypothetical protein
VDGGGARVESAEMTPDQPIIIFQHIGKTAGTTLANVLTRLYPAEDVYVTGPDPRERMRELLAMPPSKRNSYRLIHGHMSFGLHHHLDRPARYVTMLREPLDRLISDFWFQKQKQGAGEDLDVQVDDFQRHIRAFESTKLDNYYVRWLCGLPGDVEAYKGPSFEVGTVDDRLFERARSNLERHFLFVGVSDLFGQSALLLGRALRRRVYWWVSHNRTRRRPRRSQIDPSVADRFTELNRYDYQLYYLARSRVAQAWERLGTTERAWMSLLLAVNRRLWWPPARVG